MSEVLVHCVHDELIPVEKLVPNPRNPNQHPQRQIELLARVIEAQGWRVPITVSTRSGFVVRGHGRLEAARLLGCDAAPVDFQDYANEAEEWADLIADNRIAELAETDEDLLRELLREIDSGDCDPALTGFDEEELVRLLSETESYEGLTDEDDAPEVPQQPVSRPGDLWCLDPHRLLCGDGTEAANLDRLVEEKPVDLVFTDPPYNVDYDTSKRGKGRRESRPIANDSLGDGFEAFLAAACFQMLSRCSGAVYVCMASSELHTLHKAFVQAGGHWSTFIIWAKHVFALGRSDYHRQYEPILYGWKEGGKHFWCGARDQGDVWFIDKPARNDLHPTMKPVALVERAILNSSRPGQMVLDPFAGSGSTLIACEKTGRVGRLVELEPGYCDVIVRRWQEFTDKTAVLEGNGRPFSEITLSGAQA